jgi:hypothetical protein
VLRTRRKAEQTVVAKVKWVRVRLLGGHQPEIMAVAKELGMSSRASLLTRRPPTLLILLKGATLLDRHPPQFSTAAHNWRAKNKIRTAGNGANMTSLSRPTPG